MEVGGGARAGWKGGRVERVERVWGGFVGD